MEWISIKDRLPEIDKDVLVVDCNIYEVCIYDGVEFRTIDYGYFYPTHWMSLPEPPKE